MPITFVPIPSPVVGVAFTVKCIYLSGSLTSFVQYANAPGQFHSVSASIDKGIPFSFVHPAPTVAGPMTVVVRYPAYSMSGASFTVMVLPAPGSAKSFAKDFDQSFA